MPTPQLKRPATHGVFLRWPLDGTDWIHPEDVEQVSAVVPSRRVFRREDLDDEYALLTYADLKMRIRPVMWLEVVADGYLVGDVVEVKSEMGKRESLAATIREILWDPNLGRIEYHLSRGDRELDRVYSADEIQIARNLDEPLTLHQLDLLSRSRLRK
jgi:hypothetical protein